MKIKTFGKIDKSQAPQSLKVLEIYKNTGSVPKSIMKGVGREATGATKITGDSSNSIDGTNASLHSRQKGNSKRKLNNKPEKYKLPSLIDKRKNKEMIRLQQSQSNGKTTKIRTGGTGFDDSQLSIPKL